jgi:hypothetical protein
MAIGAEVFVDVDLGTVDVVGGVVDAVVSDLVARVVVLVTFVIVVDILLKFAVDDD